MKKKLNVKIDKERSIELVKGLTAAMNKGGFKDARAYRKTLYQKMKAEKETSERVCKNSGAES